jgi:hypothetical protein
MWPPADDPAFFCLAGGAVGYGPDLSELGGRTLASETVWRTAARRAIGAQLLDAAKAAYQVAADLGEDPGNTARALKRLRDEGAVTCAAGPDGPARFDLAPGQRELLLNAIEEAQPHGTLVTGQQVLTVSVEDGREGVFADVLRATARTGEVV